MKHLPIKYAVHVGLSAGLAALIPDAFTAGYKAAMSAKTAEDIDQAFTEFYNAKVKDVLDWHWLDGIPDKVPSPPLDFRGRSRQSSTARKPR